MAVYELLYLAAFLHLRYFKYMINHSVIVVFIVTADVGWNNISTLHPAMYLLMSLYIFRGR